MKLLALNPFGTGAFDDAVRDVLEKARRPDTEVIVDHLAKGPTFFRYMYFKSLAVPDIIERVIQAEKQGYEVYIDIHNQPRENRHAHKCKRTFHCQCKPA